MGTELTAGDRRTRKTKKAIKGAFLSLLKKTDVSKISVTDISALADINRKTFYSHYSSVSAVTDDLENDLAELFLNLLGENNINGFIADPYPLFKQLSKVISDDMDYYGLIFKSDASSTILEKVKKIINEKLIELVTEDSSFSSDLSPYTVSYFTAGLIGAFEVWFNSEKPISLEELSRHLNRITANGFQAIKV